MGSSAEKIIKDLLDRRENESSDYDPEIEAGPIDITDDMIIHHETFQCSCSWIQNLMGRNTFHSVKGCRESGFRHQSALFTERMKLKQRLCKLDKSCIPNTGEVGLPYRALQRRAARDSKQLSSYGLTKNRLTVVLTVHADGRMSSLTII